MACNDAKQCMLSGLATPKGRKSDGDGPKKRRQLRHVQSAPLAVFRPSDTNRDGALPRSESIFGRLNWSLTKVALQVLTLYLDLVPNSDLTKLLPCAFVFTGMALIGLLLSKAADYLMEKQEILVVKDLNMYQRVAESEVLKEIETKRVKHKFYTTLTLLLVLILTRTFFLFKGKYREQTKSAGEMGSCSQNNNHRFGGWPAGIDDDGVVGAAEFVLFKLEELGIGQDLPK
ncbi:Outward rectifying K+ channel isoform 2 [Hibiscus syriacus]|uniref:Outward rectifying K+ channel isoform 2 n=1 Tax=Hibiscus syriacus TaxID=106335 RepID=A0A6A3C9M1_HIBSY|nr:Outward rectifying K+ channel isoform 2 [Hibiscus syriacus]